MRILITGANGFIGSCLVDYLLDLKYEVVALSRSLVSNVRPGLHGFQWALGSKVPESAALNIDCAIHLAHDFNGPDGARKTTAGTIDLMHQLASLGVAKQIFFSSYSAGEHATSVYGITKFTIEQATSRVNGITILRPGLVIGNSGIFGRIANIVKKSPIIPLPDGGAGLVPIISIDRLCYETVAIIKSHEYIAYANIFEPDFFTLKDLVEKIAKSFKKTIFIFPVPAKLIVFILNGVNFLPFKLPFKLPVNGDNLTGFLANQKATHVSTLSSSDANLWN